MRAGAPGCTSRGALVGPGANGIATARILASGSRRGATTTNARASRPSAVVAMPLAGPTRRAIAAMTTRARFLLRTARAPGASSSTRRWPVLVTTRPSTAAAAADAARGEETNPRRSGPSSPSPSVVDATDDASVAFADLRPELHPKLLAALRRAGFVDATPLQTRAVPAALDDASPDGTTRDVVVAAETGSGKTLAYLVPVFSNLLRNGHGRGGEGEGGPGGNGRLGALILAPNATLCEQVKRVADSLIGDDGEPLLETRALTPDTSMPSPVTSASGHRTSSNRGLPDVVVATPARAAEDVLEFTKGGWRRGNFAPAATHVRHVVFDEADQLLSGGYLRPVRGAFDVLYREEKLAALGLTVPMGESLEGESEWAGDAARPKDGGDRAWSADHDDINVVAKRKGKSQMGKGAALGGKGEVGVGEGRDFRRQYIFAAATVMSNGKKTPGAMIRHGFPDARWIEGRRLHKAVATVDQTWVKVTGATRADALGRALALGDEERQRDRTLVFVNSTRACEEVTAELIRQGLSAAAFHADVGTRERRARLDALANGDVTVLVCTDSAARGVDVPDVVHVVQAEFAANAVDYLHRIGRTARCGASGRVTNLVSAADADLVEAVRAAEAAGAPVEGAFSRKRSFRKKFKKYGPSRTAPQNRR